MNKEETRVLSKVNLTDNLDVVEFLSLRNNIIATDAEHIKAAKAVLNIRHIKGMFNTVEEQHKKVVNSFMARRILPVQEGHIKMQWVERASGFDEEAARVAEPAAVALYTDLLTRFKAAYPKTISFVDIREVKSFVE